MKNRIFQVPQLHSHYKAHVSERALSFKAKFIPQSLFPSSFCRLPGPVCSLSVDTVRSTERGTERREERGPVGEASPLHSPSLGLQELLLCPEDIFWPQPGYSLNSVSAETHQEPLP